jgi:hypothetical protein
LQLNQGENPPIFFPSKLARNHQEVHAMARALALLCFVVVAICLMLPGNRASAQTYDTGTRVEVTPFGGFQWVTRTTNYYGGYISTKDGMNFGVAVDFELHRDGELELLYINFPSEAKAVIESGAFTSFATQYVDVTSQYFQAGYLRTLHKGGKVEPFVSGSLGAALFSGSDVRLANGTTIQGGELWRFAFTFGAGARIYFSDRIGLRLQARLMAPVYFSGGGLYFGTGGAGAALSGGIPLLMGDFTAGLIIRI